MGAPGVKLLAEKSGVTGPARADPDADIAMITRTAQHGATKRREFTDVLLSGARAAV
jgi:hypothetical protein